MENLQPKKKPSFGWLVLIGPLSIVVTLSIFEGPPWVKDQSEKGAHWEAMSFNSRGEIQFAAGNYGEAHNLFRSAIELKPDYAEPYMNLGILFHETGSTQMAKDFFRKAIERSPMKKDMIFNNLGLVYAEEAKYDTALAMFHKAAEFGIRCAPLWRNIGLTEKNRGNIAASIEAYRKVVEYRPTIENLYREMLFDALYTSGNDEYVDQVRADIDKGVEALDFSEFDEETVYYYLQHDYKVAEDFRELANAYQENGDWQNSITAFRQALKYRPDWAAIYNKIGILYAKQGMLAEAEKEFLEAISLDPSHQDFRHNLERCRRQMTQPMTIH